ncbi:MAG: hypothetical protein ACLS7Z_06310 [Christensenellales bacterium]
MGGDVDSAAVSSKRSATLYPGTQRSLRMVHLERPPCASAEGEDYAQYDLFIGMDRDNSHAWSVSSAAIRSINALMAYTGEARAK